MTVKDLKEKLNEFDDNLIISIPDIIYTDDDYMCTYAVAKSVTKGINELDCCVIIDTCEE